MPPAACDHDAVGDDLAIAGQVLADCIDVVEAAVLDCQDGGVADTAWLQAAEFRAPNFTESESRGVRRTPYSNVPRAEQCGKRRNRLGRFEMAFYCICQRPYCIDCVRRLKAAFLLFGL